VKPKAWDGESPVVQPPSSVTADYSEPRVILYTAEGQPLGRRPIGFRANEKGGK
jgi:hypothetical protein